MYFSNGLNSQCCQIWQFLLKIDKTFYHLHWIGGFSVKDHALYGFFYYDQKGVISSQYGGLSKKLVKIGYFHKSGFESSIAEEISFSNI